MHFIHQPLTWAFLLVLVPLLIHLINMMRHRRVKWAAMEFLLASYKKHRKWIWLKQLLLLMTRMLAIAAVVAIMAQLVPPDRWAKLLGGKVTHHYVLLDDSYSMTDRASGESGFNRAKQVLARIVERAAAEDTPQKLTLVRFSRAAHATEIGDAALVADVSDQPIDDGAWRESFDSLRGAMEATQLSFGAHAALEVLGNLLAEADDESRVVYVVSDFRRRDWENPTRLDQQLQQLEKSGAQVHLVDCVTAERPNLAITYLAPTEGTRSAGVPLFVKVSVQNFGAAPAEGVELTVTSYAYENFDPLQHGDDPTRIKPEPLDKRSETIEAIGPGETVSRRVQVRFPIPGKHVVEARLPDDAVAADNLRYSVIDVPEGEPVLIVDGHPERRHAYFLSAVFQPRVRTVEGEVSSAVRTGVVPTIEDAAQLRDMPLETLQGYRAVYLLDVPRLDDGAIRKLEKYVRGGGGLAFFLGDHVNPTHYSEQLYNDGQGLLPMALEEKELLSLADADDDERVPDFEVVDHPVLSIFATGSPAFRRGVVISTYYTVKEDTPPDDEAIEVLATLRDEARTPLVVARQLSEGRVLAFNTTLAPLWNNWARGHGGAPSFVVTMLQMHAFLAAPLRIDQSQPVGTEVHVQWPADDFQEDSQGIIPAVTPISRKPLEMKAALEPSREDEDVQVLSVTLGSDLDEATGRLTGRQGVYEVWGVRKSGERDVRRYALNVDPEEGNLARTPMADLAGKMQANFRYHGAGDIEYELAGQSASSWSEYILYALIVLLLGEQLLAYSASYHPGASRGMGPGPAAGHVQGGAR